MDAHHLTHAMHTLLCSFQVVFVEHRYYGTKKVPFSFSYFCPRPHHFFFGRGLVALCVVSNVLRIDRLVRRCGLQFSLTLCVCATLISGDSWTNGSFPFGTAAFEPENLRYLTVEQALADFEEVALALRIKYKAPAETAIITFGGSYGANLALWSRLKNPNIFAGAIASSVSVQKNLLRKTNAFAMVVTDAYGNVSATCPKLIRAAWNELETKGATASGRADLKTELGLCQAPSSQADAVSLGGWYHGALETMAQYGEPRALTLLAF
jgi:hypothetical protein